MNHLQITLAAGLTAILALSGCSRTPEPEKSNPVTLKTDQVPPASSLELHSPVLRSTIFALVSSAENSTTDYEKEYSYIEDIGDGRGYTCGLIGFTSGTGDLLDVVKLYIEKQPDDNLLQPYLKALEAVNGTDSHEGLGEEFEKAWKKACQDPAMKEAQNEVISELYYDPAISFCDEDGLPALGLYIYYDTLVVHGPGDDPDSFGGIRQAALKNARTPAQGGDLADWLMAFLKARTAVMKQEVAHSDLSRIEVQEQFIREKNWTLSRPLSWEMYGDSFSLE